MNTFYEFFAGGGMARAGLGPSWNCLFANDFCEKKAQSYAANWGREHLVVADVNRLSASDLPGQADLAWASFPCQDLSLAGNGSGLRGERSGSFWGFWNIMQGLAAQDRKPGLVMLENVLGAVTSHGGRDFEAILEALANEGYRFGAMIIDAVHFVPQSRPRLFILGVKQGLSVPLGLVAQRPYPAWHPASLISAYNRLPPGLKEKWLWWDPPMPKERLKTLDDLVEMEPSGVDWHSPVETERLLGMMSEVHRRKVLEAQRAGRLKVGALYRRTREGVQRAEVRFDGISGCLRTPLGGSSRQTIVVVDGPRIRTRLLSPREGARLMGLPDSYILPERYNDAYHLTGDGVVVPVVSHLADWLLSPIMAASGSVPVEMAA